MENALILKMLGKSYKLLFEFSLTMTSFCENCNDVDKSRDKIPANCVNKGLPVLRIFSVVGGGGGRRGMCLGQGGGMFKQHMNFII